MGDTSKVVWSEGLFLRTQHFQQQDRYTEGLVRGAINASSLQTFGYRTLILDESALSAGRVGIESASGVLSDGTPFSIPGGMDVPEPLEVTSETRSGLVHLALPLQAPGAANIDPAHEDPSGARYHGEIIRVRDAIRGGAEAEDIEVAKPVAKLLPSGQEHGGYTTLPIARIDGLKADGSVALAENYLPPGLVTSTTPLYAKLLTEVLHGLDRIAEAHGQIIVSGSGRSIDNLMILELANTARPRLAHLLHQNLFHPSEVFLELAGLAGRMATYGSGNRRMSELTAYDHMDPQAAFDDLTNTLRSLILTLRHVEQKTHVMAVAKHSDNVWKVRIDTPDLLRNSRIVLRIGSDMSDQELRRIFVDQITVGSADGFEALWKTRLAGIPLKPLHSQPKEIPYDGDSLCLELDQKSEHWASLEGSPGFVVGVSGKLVGQTKVDCYAVKR